VTTDYFNDVREFEETVEKDASAAGAHCTISSHLREVTAADVR
jgi:hypothetical protein